MPFNFPHKPRIGNMKRVVNVDSDDLTGLSQDEPNVKVLNLSLTKLKNMVKKPSSKILLFSSKKQN